MRERILAVVGAVGLVVAALVIRSMIAGDDGGGGGGTSADGGGDSGGKPVVACDADLRSVCDALAAEGLIAEDPPSLALSAAAEPDAAIDAWITWDPAPGIANFDAPDAGQSTWDEPQVLASAPLGVLIAGAPEPCGPPTPGWQCVLDIAADGRPVGVGTGGTAQSLSRLYPLAAALVPADGDFTDVSSLDLRRVLDSPQVRQADVRAQINTLLTQRGALDAVVGPVPALQQASSRRPTATVVVPEPAATISVVISSRAGREPLDADELVAGDRIGAALEALGLEVGTGDPAPARTAGDLYSVREKID